MWEKKILLSQQKSEKYLTYVIQLIKMVIYWVCKERKSGREITTSWVILFTEWNVTSCQNTKNMKAKTKTSSILNSEYICCWFQPKNIVE